MLAAGNKGMYIPSILGGNTGDHSFAQSPAQKKLGGVVNYYKPSSIVLIDKFQVRPSWSANSTSKSKSVEKKLQASTYTFAGLEKTRDRSSKSRDASSSQGFQASFDRIKTNLQVRYPHEENGQRL